MVSCESGVEVGRRVAVGEHLGTVRYVGPIPSAKGTWLGIEWDDPKRGKHNGTYDGHSYFKTRHPTAGSFIHIEKADLGRSFTSALKERYASNQLTLTVEELQDIQRAMNAPHVEMVGFDKVNEKQSCFSDLEVISLHNYQVCCAGEDLASMCLKARDVDLSLNLLTTWSEVAKIITHMTEVEMLNLSFNKLVVPENPESDAFRNLSHIVLGHMDYTWEEVITCSKMWPQVHHLQVPFNNITSITVPKDALGNLTHLDLEGNQISDWEEINKLGVLENLESLNLCAMGLTNIKLPPSENIFKNLQCLFLSDNNIAKWEFVSQLGKLTKLHELRFSNNPVLENLSLENMHSKIIARIGSLEVLNRKNVSNEERRGAEMEYLKEYGKAWLLSLKNEIINTQFLLHHPCFPDLVQKHGLPEEDVDSSSKSLRSNFVKVRLCGSSKAISKSLPKTMEISELCSLIRRLFKLGSVDLNLSYRSYQNPDIYGPLDSIFQTLNFYSIEDFDEIFFTIQN